MNRPHESSGFGVLTSLRLLGLHSSLEILHLLLGTHQVLERLPSCLRELEAFPMDFMSYWTMPFSQRFVRIAPTVYSSSTLASQGLVFVLWLRDRFGTGGFACLDDFLFLAPMFEVDE